MVRLVRMAAALAAGCVAACGGEAPSPGAVGPTVRDSAGVRIVENGDAASAVELAWTVGDEPEVVIGADEDAPAEEQLYQVTDATRLSDGRIAVVVGGAQEVRIFSTEGAYLSRIGGPGEGPGEFQFPFHVTRLANDTLLVWDGPRMRAHWFDAEGGYARSEMWGLDRVAHAAAAPFRAVADRVLPNGDVLITILQPNGSEAGATGDIYRQRAGLVSAPPDVSAFDTIGLYLEQERVPMIALGRPLDMAALGARMTLTAVGVSSSRVCFGDQARTEIICSDPRGRRIAMRWGDAPVPVTAAEVAALREAILARGGSGPMGELRRQTVPDLPVADAHPYFAAVHIDAIDHVWAYDVRADGAVGRTQTLVFDSDGALLGRIDVSELDIFEIGEDDILGVARDDFDVERVELYRLTR